MNRLEEKKIGSLMEEERAESRERNMGGEEQFLVLIGNEIGGLRLRVNTIFSLVIREGYNSIFATF